MPTAQEIWTNIKNENPEVFKATAAVFKIPESDMPPFIISFLSSYLLNSVKKNKYKDFLSFISEEVLKRLVIPMIEVACCVPECKTLIAVRIEDKDLLHTCINCCEKTEVK